MPQHTRALLTTRPLVADDGKLVTMAIPQRFGRYWLHERIGRGGMADVFRATLSSAAAGSFDFAVKRMHPQLASDAHYREMFTIEAYTHRLLTHPNIVRLYEAGEEGGVPFIAMEYVRGTDLESLLDSLGARHLRLPADLAIYITLQLLRSLDYVHRARSTADKPLDIIHRDVSPENLYLSFAGEVKLGDFGVARVHMLERTDARWVKGKLAYIPPEVLAGSDMTQSWDLWSTGVCLFEMLTGKKLFGELDGDAIRALGEAGKFPANDIGPEHGKELRRIVAEALHPKPSKRFADAATFYRELKAYAVVSGITPSHETLARFVLASVGNVGSLSRAQESPKDWLTGAFCERHLLELLRIEIERAQRYGRVLSVLILDLDDFRAVGEALGPAVSEALLAGIVSPFLSDVAALRSCDVVARRFGDTFCILLPETPLEGAVKVAERLRRHLQSMDWRRVCPEFSRRLTASIGAASFPAHGQTVGALLEAAHMALYEAKLKGKNRVATASAELSALKASVGAGTANPHEQERWRSLQARYRAARGDSEQGPVELVFHTDEELVRAWASDIAGGGLRVALGQSYAAGTRLQLRLRIGDDPTIHLATAQVYFAGTEVVGLQFLHQPDALARRIEAVLWRWVGSGLDT